MTEDTQRKNYEVITRDDSTTLILHDPVLTIDEEQLAITIMLLNGVVAHMEDEQHHRVMDKMEQLASAWSKDCPLCGTPVTVQ